MGCLEYIRRSGLACHFVMEECDEPAALNFLAVVYPFFESNVELKFSRQV